MSFGCGCCAGKEVLNDALLQLGFTQYEQGLHCCARAAVDEEEFTAVFELRASSSMAGPRVSRFDLVHQEELLAMQGPAEIPIGTQFYTSKYVPYAWKSAPD